MTTRGIIWNASNITIGPKIRLMCFLVMSMFWYAYETWIMSADIEGRIQAMRWGVSVNSHSETTQLLRARYSDIIIRTQTLIQRQHSYYGPDIWTSSLVRVTLSSWFSKVVLRGKVLGGRRRDGQGKESIGRHPQGLDKPWLKEQRTSKRTAEISGTDYRVCSGHPLHGIGQGKGKWEQLWWTDRNPRRRTGEVIARHLYRISS